MFGPTAIWSALQRGRLILGALVAAGVLAGVSAPAANGTDMHCGTPAGYCYWGYNLVGPSTNAYVQGTWNYWDDQYIDKTSGGLIKHGFGPSNCFHGITGAGSWYGYPADLGCGGYLQPQVWYWSGNTSYLYFDDYA